MTIDLLNDLIILWGVKVHISTLITWGSGLIGLFANWRQIKRLNDMEDSKQRDRAIKEIAERSYLKIERIVKLTPTKIDDKLIAYMRLAFQAYEDKYKQKPTQEEVKELMAEAEKKATDDKIRSKK